MSKSTKSPPYWLLSGYVLILLDVLLIVKKMMHEEEISSRLQTGMTKSTQRAESGLVLLGLSLPGF